MGPRWKWHERRPHEVKIVTKQYSTYVENYFKGMETIKELYWESLRAPEDPVNVQRNPYLRQMILKKFYGKTGAERR